MPIKGDSANSLQRTSVRLARMILRHDRDQFIVRQQVELNPSCSTDGLPTP